MLHNHNLLLNNLNISIYYPLFVNNLFDCINYLSNLNKYINLMEISNYVFIWSNTNLFKNIILFDINYSLVNYSLNTELNSFAIENSLNHNLVYTNYIKLMCNPFLLTINSTKFIYLILLIIFIFYFFNLNILKLNFIYLILNTLFQKISDVSEQEYGSFDDFQILLVYLFYIFSTYLWVVTSWYLLTLYSNSWIFSGLIIMTVFMISIPVKLLIDMGSSFFMYVRGASNSSNLIVELIFDLIGIIIVFTRFILQNIRLVLVFLAYFELFEWIVMGFEFNNLLNIVFTDNNLNLLSSYNLNISLLTILIMLTKTIFIYLYHLLHLIIVSFVQIGIYLMISFWLFFFFYTSSNKILVDSYFINKKSI